MREVCDVVRRRGRILLCVKERYAYVNGLRVRYGTMANCSENCEPLVLNMLMKQEIYWPAE
jgi:hypothetical protein